MKVGFMPVTSIQKYSWIESDYYYAPADRRTHTGWVTVNATVTVSGMTSSFSNT